MLTIDSLSAYSNRVLDFTERNARWFLFVVLIAGTLVRIVGIPHAIGSHPDERHMVSVVERMSFSDLNPKSFAYGSLSYYMAFFVSEGLGQIWPYLKGYDGIYYVGRSLCVLFGMLTVFFTYLLGAALSQSKLVGLIATTLLSFNFFHIQLSRFFTSDIPLTFFCTFALYYMVKFTASPGNKSALLAGLGAGLALACKIAAVYLVIPFLAALAVVRWKQRETWKALAAQSSIFGMCTALAFVIFSPYALLDYVVFRDQVLEQVRMVRGEWRPPYIIQFEKTTPFWYPLQEIGRFTASWLILAASIAGMAAAGYRKNFLVSGHVTVLVWALLFFGLTAGMPVKFPRYLLPIYPVIFIFASEFCYGLMRSKNQF